MSTTDATPPPPPRRGTATRARARQVALALFTERGYEATSLREIAEELGMNKASLYYHFPSKEAILRSLLEERGTEAADLLTWLREQPRTPGLLEDTVLRWVGTFTSDKLAAIRFTTANPLTVASLAKADGERIGAALTAVADELVALLPERSDEAAVLVRMALLSINAAVQAAAGSGLSDADTIAAAHRAARALVNEVGAAR